MASACFGRRLTSFSPVQTHEGVLDNMEVPNPSSPHHPPYFSAFQLAAPLNSLHTSSCRPFTPRLS